MRLKDEINMQLDLYQSELSGLLFEAEDLYSRIFSESLEYWENNPIEYNKISNQIESLSIHHKALEECRNDSIMN
jgi:hypothetical protein